jgi:hypothetical protein
MPFGLKNAPPTHQRVVSKAFKDYLDDFMKLFLDYFMVFGDLDTHLSKLQKCFKKCWKYGISLNSKKCAFMVFLGMILCFIVSKEGKLLDPKKFKMIIKMPIPKNPHDIQVFNSLAQFYQCFVKKIAFYGTHHNNNAKIEKKSFGFKNAKMHRRPQSKNTWRP